MNKIFKVIFNKAKGCYVVVSEIAKANGKSKSARVKVAASIGAIFAVNLLVGSTVYAWSDPSFYIESIYGNITTGKGQDNEWDKDKNLFSGTGSTSDLNKRQSKYAIMLNPTFKNSTYNVLDRKTQDTYAYSNRASVGDQAVAIGVNSGAQNLSSIAIGANAHSESSYGVTIGDSALTFATSSSALALGNVATVNGSYSVALGAYSRVGAKAHSAANTVDFSAVNSAVAIGDEAKTEVSNSVALGSHSAVWRGTNANQQGSLFGGEYKNNVYGDAAVANTIKAGGNNAAALKGSAVVSVGAKEGSFDTVVQSVTDGKVSLTIKENGGYQKALTRRIINVAAGTDDADAVNMLQLRSLAANKIRLEDNDGNKTTGISLGSETDHAEDRLTFRIVGENGVTTKAEGNTITVGFDKSKLDGLGGSSSRAFNTDRGDITVKNGPLNVIGGYNQDNNPQYWKDAYKKANGIESNEISTLDPEKANALYESGLSDGNIAVYKDPAKADTMNIKLAKNVSDLDSVRIGKKTEAETQADGDANSAASDKYKIIMEGQDGSITGRYIYSGTESSRQDFITKARSKTSDGTIDYSTVAANDVNGALMSSVTTPSTGGPKTTGYVVSNNVIANDIVANRMISMNTPNNTLGYGDADMAAGLYNGALFTATRDSKSDQTYTIKSVLNKDGLITQRVTIGDPKIVQDKAGLSVRDASANTKDNSIIIEQGKYSPTSTPNPVPEDTTRVADYREITGLTNKDWKTDDQEFLNKVADSSKAVTEAQLKKATDGLKADMGKTARNFSTDVAGSTGELNATANDRVGIVGGNTEIVNPDYTEGTSPEGTPKTKQASNISTSVQNGKIAIALNKDISVDSVGAGSVKAKNYTTFGGNTSITDSEIQAPTITAKDELRVGTSPLYHTVIGSFKSTFGGPDNPITINHDPDTKTMVAGPNGSTKMVNTIEGLSNTKWDSSPNYPGFKENRAATEGQLRDLEAALKASQSGMVEGVTMSYKADDYKADSPSTKITNNTTEILGIVGGATATTQASGGATQPIKNITTAVSGKNIEISLNKDLKGLDSVEAKSVKANSIDLGDNGTITGANANTAYTGDVGGKITRAFGANLNVKGGVSDETNLTTNNIGVVGSAEDGLSIRLAKNLTGLGTVSAESLTTSGGATINGQLQAKDGAAVTGGLTTDTVTASGEVTANGGVTVKKGLTTDTLTTSGKAVLNGEVAVAGPATFSNSATFTKGASMGGNAITNVAKGVNGTDAVNKDQLDEAVQKGWNLAVNGTSTPITQKDNKNTANFAAGDNLTASIDTGSRTVTYALNKTVSGLDSIGATKGNIGGVNFKGAGTGVDFGNTPITSTAKISTTGELSGGTVKADGTKPVTMDGNTGLVSGLSNTTWDKQNPSQYQNSNKAATEAQVYQASDAAADAAVKKAKRKFTADDNQNFEATLDTAVGVKGGKTDGKTQNITTSISGNDIVVTLNKDLSNLGTVGADAVNTKDLNTTGASTFGGTTTFNGDTVFNTAPTFKTTINTNGLTNKGELTTDTLHSKDKATFDKDVEIKGKLTGANINTKYQGDSGDVVTRGLSETLTVKGGVNDVSKLSSNNIGVTNDGTTGLTIALAKDVQGLDSLSTKTLTTSEGANIGGTLTSHGIENTGNITSTGNITTTTGTVSGQTVQATQDVTAGRNVTAVGDITTTDGTVSGKKLKATESVTTKDLTATGTTQLQDATVAKNLTVNGTTTTNGIQNNGDISTTNMTASGKTTTGTLEVTGKSDFKDVATLEKGADLNNQKITNLADGTAPNDAVNKSQLDKAINAGWDIKVGEDKATVTQEGKKNDATFAAGSNLDVNLDKTNRTVTYSLKNTLTDLSGITSTTGNIGGVDFKGNKGGVDFDGNAITNAGNITSTGTVTGGTFTTSGKNTVTISGDKGTIDGLTNKKWDSSNPDQYKESGKAATEAQVYQAAKDASTGAVSGAKRKFKANNGDEINTELSTPVGIVGAAADATTAQNITTKTNGNNIEVVLNKNLSNLGTVGADAVNAKTLTTTEGATIGGKLTAKNGADVTGGLTTDTLTTSGAANFNGPTTFANTTTFTKPATFQEGASFTKPITTNGINNTGELTTTQLHATGPATFDGNVTVGGNLTGANINTKYQGDFGTAVTRNLGQTLTVKGGASAETELTSGNIGVTNDGDGGLKIGLVKALTGLESVSTGSLETSGNAKVGGTLEVDNTSTFKEKATFQKGADMGGEKITNVQKGTEDTDAVNKKQLDDAVNAGWNLKSGNNTANVTPKGGKNDASFAAGKNLTAELNEGTRTITYKLNDEVKGLTDIEATKGSIGGVSFKGNGQGVDFGGNAITTTGDITSTTGTISGNTLKGNTVQTTGAHTVTMNGTDGTISGLTNTTWDKQNAATKYQNSNKAATEAQVYQAARDIATDTVGAVERKFTADVGGPLTTTLGTEVGVKGAAADGSSNNISTKIEGNDIKVMLNKDLKGLGSVSADSVTTKGLTVNGPAAVTGKLTASGGAEVSNGLTTDTLNTTGEATVGGKLTANGGLEVKNGINTDTVTATGDITTTGDISGKDVKATGTVSAENVKAKDTVSAKKLKADESVETKDLTATGKVQTKDLETTGTSTFGGATTFNGDTNFTKGATFSGTTTFTSKPTFQAGATFSKPIDTTGINNTGNITNTGDLSTDTLHTTGDASFGKDVTIAGTLTGAKINTQYKGDFGDTVTRNLADVLTVKGGASAEAGLTSGNIAVTGNKADGSLTIALAKNLTGLGSVAADSVTTTGAVTANGGLTVGGPAVFNGTAKFTQGADMGGKVISNVGDGQKATDAVNKGQLDKALENGWELEANKKKTNVGLTGDKKNAVFEAGNNLSVDLNQDTRTVTYSLKNVLTGLSSITSETGNIGGVNFKGSNNGGVDFGGNAITNAGPVDASKFETSGNHHVITDGTTGTISGLANTAWDITHADRLYKGSDKAATEAQVYEAAKFVSASTVADVDRVFTTDDKGLISTGITSPVGVNGGTADRSKKNITTKTNGDNIEIMLNRDLDGLGTVTAETVNTGGLTATGTSTFSGPTTFSGDTTFNTAPTFTKGAKFEEPITTKGITNTGDISNSGKLTTESLETTGGATFGGDVKVNGKLTGANVNTKYAGDFGDAVTRGLSETLNVKGEVAQGTELTSGNIGVTAVGPDTLKVQLAKNLTGLGSIGAESLTTSGTATVGGALTTKNGIVNTGTITSTGDISSDSKVKGKSIESTTTISAGSDITAGGNITANGKVTGNDIEAKNSLKTKTLEVTSTAKTNGITNKGDITTDTLTTTGNATVGGKLDVKDTAKFEKEATFEKGADMNKQKITNVAEGTEAGDAVNKGQLDAAVNKGWDVKVGNDSATVTPQDGKNNATFVAGKNLTASLDQANRKVTYALADSLKDLADIKSSTGTIGGVTFNGKDNGGVDFGGNGLKNVSGITATGPISSTGDISADGKVSGKTLEAKGTHTITANSDNGTITGLTNTEWNTADASQYDNSNKAATESQVYKAAKAISDSAVGAAERKFKANDGNSIATTLSNPVGILGAATEGGSQNITTKVDGTDIKVMLNKNLADLGTVGAETVNTTNLTTSKLTANGPATFNGAVNATKGLTVTEGITTDKLHTTGNATVDGDLGVTGTATFGKTATFTQGANMGNNRVTGVAEGSEDTDAVNVKQLNDAVNEGWTIKVKSKSAKVTKKENKNDATFKAADDNLTVDLDEAGRVVTYGLSKTLTGLTSIASDTGNIGGVNFLGAGKGVNFGNNDIISAGNITSTGTVSGKTVKATGDHEVIVDGTAGTIDGLTNKTWDKAHAKDLYENSGKAATEAQVYKAAAETSSAAVDALKRNFTADDSHTISTSLTQAVGVKGGQADGSAKNITTKVNGNDIEVMLNKDLSELGSVGADSITTNTLTTNQGATIGGKLTAQKGIAATGGISTDTLTASDKIKTKDLEATGTSNFSGPANFTGTTNFGGTTTFSTAPTFSEGATFNKPITTSGITNNGTLTTGGFHAKDDATFDKNVVVTGTLTGANINTKYAGDTGGQITRNLSEVLKVQGGVTSSDALTSGNIGVVSNGSDTLKIQLAKALKDLDSVSTNTLTTSSTATIGGELTTKGGIVNTGTITSTSDITSQGKVKGNAVEATTNITAGGDITAQGKVSGKDIEATNSLKTKDLTATGNTNLGATTISSTLNVQGKTTTKGIDNTNGLTTDTLTTTDNAKIGGNLEVDGTSDFKQLATFEKGANMGGNKITNVAAGDSDNDAVNVKQLNDAVNTGWDIKVGTKKATVTRENGKNNATFNAGNNLKVDMDSASRTVTYSLADSLTGLTNIEAGKGTIGGVTFNGPNFGVNFGGNTISNVGDISSTGTIEGNKFKTTGDNPVTIDGTEKTITGLSNTDWDKDNAKTKYENSGKAATEAQVYKAAKDASDNAVGNVTRAFTADDNAPLNVTLATKVGIKGGKDDGSQKNIKTKVNGDDIEVILNKDLSGLGTVGADTINTNTLTTTGPATFGGATNFNGEVNFSKPVSFSDTVTFNKPITTKGINNTGGLNTDKLHATDKATFDSDVEVKGKLTGANINTKYMGDYGNEVTRNLGDVLNLKGGASPDTALTTGNIGVTNDGVTGLKIGLVKNLSGLGSIGADSLTTTGAITAGGKLTANQGAEVTGGLKADHLETEGNATVGGKLTVTGTTETNGITNNGEISTETLTTSGKATVGGPLEVKGASTFDEAATFKKGANMNGNTITGLGRGVNDTDAVNKAQLDEAVNGGWKLAANGKTTTITPKNDNNTASFASGNANGNLKVDLNPTDRTVTYTLSDSLTGLTNVEAAKGNIGGVTFNGTTNGGVDFGGNTITNAGDITSTGTVKGSKFVTSGGNAVTVDGATGTITGLTNTTWDGTPVSGRAATEDQLAQLSDAAAAKAKAEAADAVKKAKRYFTADDNTVLEATLGDHLAVKGGNTVLTDDSTKNVSTRIRNNSIEVYLNKDLNGLDSANIASTNINSDGVLTNGLIVTGDASVTGAFDADSVTANSGEFGEETGSKVVLNKDGFTYAGNPSKNDVKTTTIDADGLSTEGLISSTDKDGNSTLIEGPTITSDKGGNKTVVEGSTITATTKEGDSTKVDGAKVTVKTKDGKQTVVNGDVVTVGDETTKKAVKIDGGNATVNIGQDDAKAINLNGNEATIEAGENFYADGANGDLSVGGTKGLNYNTNAGAPSMTLGGDTGIKLDATPNAKSISGLSNLDWSKDNMDGGKDSRTNSTKAATEGQLAKVAAQAVAATKEVTMSYRADAEGPVITNKSTDTLGIVGGYVNGKQKDANGNIIDGDPVKNINTKVNNGNIEITLANDVKGLNSISTNTLSTLGDAAIGGKLAVDGDSAFKGNATFTGKATFNGGIDAGNKQIANVAEGEADSDAVNVKQLNDAIKKFSGGRDRMFQGDEADDAGKVTVSSTNSLKLKGGESDRTNLTDGNIGVIKNSAGDGYDIKLSKNVDGLNSLYAKNEVGIDNGPKLTAKGLDNAGQGIHNVAPGIEGTDAVNLNQLNAVDGRLNSVGAMSAAMASLKPLQYDPYEPTQIMAGVGMYRKSGAVALGIAHFKNEALMIHGGVSVGTNDLMANLGVTWKVGKNYKDKDSFEYEKYMHFRDPISKINTMWREIITVRAENDMLQKVVLDQREKNKEQQEQITAQQKQIDAQQEQIREILKELAAIKAGK